MKESIVPVILCVAFFAWICYPFYIEIKEHNREQEMRAVPHEDFLKFPKNVYLMKDGTVWVYRVNDSTNIIKH